MTELLPPQVNEDLYQALQQTISQFLIPRSNIYVTLVALIMDQMSTTMPLETIKPVFHSYIDAMSYGVVEVHNGPSVN